MRDESLNGHTTANSSNQLLFNFDAIESEDQDADTLFGFSQRFKDGFDSIFGLNKQLHSLSPRNAATGSCYRRCNLSQQGCIHLLRQHSDELVASNCAE
jgi:hypothetical protein